MNRNLTIATVLMSAAIALAKTESFDKDPSWEGFQNHVAAKKAKTVKQDFGYSETNFAGKETGEIGGTIWRSSTQASYADAIEPKTLNDRLSATFTFALKATSGSSGAFFGWFKADNPDSGRQNSLGIRIAGEGAGGRITLQLVTAKNQACGTKVTPWTVDKTKARGEGRKVRPPAVHNDGTRYTCKLAYDPDGAGGNGQMSFTIQGNGQKHEDFEGKTYAVDLPAGYKDQGTTFNRFGIMNSVKPGNSLTIYFDDIEHDGKTQDLSKDPGWIASGNRTSYDQHEEGGGHDFGFTDQNHFAAASPGEVGGIMWRSGSYAYYADRVGPLSLDDKLEASGKVILTTAPPDSGIYIGWFNSEQKTLSPPQAGSFLAVKIGGPTRVGHYFLPAYATTQTKLPDRGDKEHPPNISVERGQGPVLTPQKVFNWKLVYDPAANDGNGAIEVTLGDETVKLPLKPGDKAKGASFDRFGLFTTHRGGSFVKIYFDDLNYTASR